MKKPNYREYSIQELEGVLSKIDRVKFSDRIDEIEDLLRRRRQEASTYLADMTRDLNEHANMPWTNELGTLPWPVVLHIFWAWSWRAFLASVASGLFVELLWLVVDAGTRAKVITTGVMSLAWQAYLLRTAMQKPYRSFNVVVRRRGNV